MDAHLIELGKNFVSYSCFGRKKTVYYDEIIKIEMNYVHQNIKTIAPVLHIVGQNNELEIPFGLFESKFEFIHQTIRKNIFLP